MHFLFTKIQDPCLCLSELTAVVVIPRNSPDGIRHNRIRQTNTDNAYRMGVDETETYGQIDGPRCAYQG